MTKTTSPTVELKNAKLGHDRMVLFENLSLTFQPGELIALIGPNGSGKTTLVRAIMGLHPLMAGELTVLGSNPNHHQALADKISYVPQRMTLNRSVPLSVYDFFCLKNGHVISREEALHALKKAGLESLSLDESLHRLSGGQTQRVFLAFAFLGSPQLICLDEATEGMDVAAQEDFFRRLCEVTQKTQACVVLVSHDITAITQHAKRVICVYRNILFDGEPGRPDFHSCLHKMYGENSLIHHHDHHHDH